jgi:hypothetical protein
MLSQLSDKSEEAEARMLDAMDRVIAVLKQASGIDVSRSTTVVTSDGSCAVPGRREYLAAYASVQPRPGLLRVSFAMSLRGRLADYASDDDMEGAELWNALANDVSLVIKDGGRYASRVSTTSSRNRDARLSSRFTSRISKYGP